MSSSCILDFSDPDSFVSAVRGAEVNQVVTQSGDYRVELIRIDLGRIKLQRSRESLARISHIHLPGQRAACFFLADDKQQPIHIAGRDLSPGEIIFDLSSVTHHDRTSGACHWAAMNLPIEDFAAAWRAIVGRDLIIEPVPQVRRPRPEVFCRLLNLHECAEQLAKADSLLLTQPELARALDHELVHTMIQCLADESVLELGCAKIQHSTVITRLEAFLASSADQPLYLEEICSAVGVSERTLRICCNEQFGMGPMRYLWHRRMDRAHRALLTANFKNRSVTDIATEVGFSELGRFSVEYRSLFGETPSATMQRTPYVQILGPDALVA